MSGLGLFRVGPKEESIVRVAGFEVLLAATETTVSAVPGMLNVISSWLPTVKTTGRWSPRSTQPSTSPLPDPIQTPRSYEGPGPRLDWILNRDHPDHQQVVVVVGVVHREGQGDVVARAGIIAVRLEWVMVGERLPDGSTRVNRISSSLDYQNSR